MSDRGRERTMLRGGPHDGLTKFRAARDAAGRLDDIRVAGVVYRWTGEVEEGRLVFDCLGADRADRVDEWDAAG